MKSLGFLILLTLGVVTANHEIPWWIIKAAQEQGPNVCAVEEVPETNRKYYTECKYWRPRLICGKQSVVKYECCEGYRMVPGQLGCTGVKPLTDVVETARSIGATKFAKLLEKSGIARELNGGVAVTLFAPTDESFDAYLKLYGIKPERLGDRKYNDLVLNHIVNKRLLSNGWKADLLVESRLPRHKLRINRYSNQVETVNCEEVIRKNQHATNGVVHLINGVLDPALSQHMDIADIVAEDGRFSVLAKALEKSKVVRKIRGSQIPHTIFAPSDEAFQKIPRTRLNKILEDRETLDALLANHIVAHPVCLPGVLSEHHAKTLGPHKVTLDCDEVRGPTFENKRLRQDFLHGDNGLLYMIDDVLLPDRAKTVLELAEDEKLYAFTQLIKEAGLEDAFTNFEPYTLFAPSEAAMYSIPEKYLEEMKRDQDKAKKFILNHAIFGRYTTDAVSDNQAALSLDEKTPLRFQVYRGSVGIEDALIEKSDREGSNGVLHIISKVLHPTIESLDDVLRTNGNFSIWLEAMDKMREIQPETFAEFRRPESSYTYFVPSDEAFRKLGDARLHRLMGDKHYLTKTLKNHVAENMMASEGFKTDLQYAVKTQQNTVDIVKRNDEMRVNDARLTKCDMLNRYGVAHAINRVLLPDQHYKRKRGARRVRT